MRIRFNKSKKHFIVFAAFFTVLFLSYSFNIFHVVDKEFFHGFERQPEGVIIGRVLKSDKEGLFSQGALIGINHEEGYNPNKAKEGEQAYWMSAQMDMYLTNKAIPDGYSPYMSQTGGQGFVFGLIHKISPFSNVTNMKIFRMINCSLVAFVFVLILAWIRRNFGWMASGVSLFLLLISPWITYYGHNLWWVLWSFYFPFVLMLYIMEKRSLNIAKYPNKKIYLYAFLGIFVKCLFSGFEFISTSLVCGMIPIVFYLIKDNKAWKASLILFLKTSLVMIAGVLAEMLILIQQLRAYFGNYQQAIDQIVFSYTRRTHFGADKADETTLGVFLRYLKGNVFDHGFLPQSMPVYFGLVLLVMLICGGIIYYFRNRVGDRQSRLDMALVWTLLISFSAPLSWIILFAEHASEHPHLDYIVWYLPTFIIGFIAIGRAIELSYPRK